MQVILATKKNEEKIVREYTFQEEFPLETECKSCDGMCRLGFIAHELDEPIKSKGGKYLCSRYENDPDGGVLGGEDPSHKGEGYWLHDACVVAVYFCKKCLQPTALYNQA